MRYDACVTQYLDWLVHFVWEDKNLNNGLIQG